MNETTVVELQNIRWTEGDKQVPVDVHHHRRLRSRLVNGQQGRTVQDRMTSTDTHKAVTLQAKRQTFSP